MGISEFDEDVRIQFDEDQIRRFYLPLAGYLFERSAGRICLITGIAGSPGSGKTSFTRLLAGVINHCLGVERIAVHIGMDGWHYPTTYLETHLFLADGIRKPLKEIKGAPQTFDLKSFYTFIKDIQAGKSAFYPVYSRKSHDVVPEAGKITSETRFILCEGNYLHFDEDGWRDVANAFDVRIFIDAPEPILRSALRKRHLNGGKELYMAEKFIEEVDMKNAALIQNNRLPADVEIIKKDEIKIGEIRLKKGQDNPTRPDVSIRPETPLHD